MIRPRAARLLLAPLFLLSLCSAITPARAADSPHGDALIPPRPASTLSAAGAPAVDQPSAFMAGRVAVQLLFVESDGAAEPSTEDWTSAQIADIQARIGEALEWWRARLPAARLSFDLTARSVGSRYEPIVHTLGDESLWISDTLAQMGYTGASHFDQAYAADDALRRTRGADWATTIFVVNSAADADGSFADGYFAYAYIGGPFLVVTSDVGLYGTQQISPIVAHEFGHIFGALDQYAAAGTPCNQRSGYLAMPTTNSQDNDCGTHFDSIMLNPVPAYQSGMIDASALGQLGYRDADGDGRPDPLDTTPALQFTIRQPPGGGQPGAIGQASDQPYPAPLENPITINTVSLVECQIDGGPWFALPPADGGYDSAAEPISATLPLYDGAHQIALRARNSVGSLSAPASASVTVQGVGAQPSYTAAVPGVSKTTAITVNLGAPIGASAQISEDPLFAGAAWVAASAGARVQLGASDGLHTLYIRFRDSAGHEAQPITRRVLLDREPPLGRGIIRPASPPQLELSAYDSGSGVVAMAIGASRDTPGEWVPFLPSSALPAGSERVWAYLRDAAGNVSSPFLVQGSYLLYLPLIRSR